jgi:hypothetical protein
MSEVGYIALIPASYDNHSHSRLFCKFIVGSPTLVTHSVESSEQYTLKAAVWSQVGWLT